MENYILAESFGRPQIRSNLWYVMEATDLETLKDNENLQFGDRAFVFETGTYSYMGNDGDWYPKSDDK